MRKPNQLDAEILVRLYELRREPELRKARAWVMSQPALSWDEVKARYMTQVEEDRQVRMVSSYWQMVATLVNRGLLHPELFFDHTGEDIVTWEKCKGWTEGARRDIRPSYLLEFEKMVKAHQAYRQRQNETLREKNEAPPLSARASSPPRGSRRGGNGPVGQRAARVAARKR